MLHFYPNELLLSVVIHLLWENHTTSHACVDKSNMKLSNVLG